MRTHLDILEDVLVVLEEVREAVAANLLLALDADDDVDREALEAAVSN